MPFLGVSSPDLFDLCMVSEWMEYGNLLSYVKKRPDANRLNLVCALCFLLHLFTRRCMKVVDVARGLSYIHGLGLVHGDLKSVSSSAYFLT